MRKAVGYHPIKMLDINRKINMLTFCFEPKVSLLSTSPVHILFVWKL